MQINQVNSKSRVTSQTMIPSPYTITQWTSHNRTIPCEYIAMAYRASPWFTVGANGMQTSRLTNFVPESCLPFFKSVPSREDMWISPNRVIESLNHWDVFFSGEVRKQCCQQRIQQSPSQFSAFFALRQWTESHFKQFIKICRRLRNYNSHVSANTPRFFLCSIILSRFHLLKNGREGLKIAGIKDGFQEVENQ